MSETRSAIPPSPTPGGTPKPAPRPRRRPAGTPGQNPGQNPGLGGALMVLFWCACGITALPLAGLFSLIAATGVSGATWALTETFAGTTLQSYVLRLGLWPQLVLFAWGISFVVLTVMRSRLTLTVAPVVLVAWVAVSAYCQFAMRAAMAPDGATLADFAALMPGILAQIAATGALFGYFREGTRPKAYYNRG